MQNKIKRIKRLERKLRQLDRNMDYVLVVMIEQRINWLKNQIIVTLDTYTITEWGNRIILSPKKEKKIREDINALYC